MIRRLLSLLAVAVSAFLFSNCAVSSGPGNNTGSFNGGATPDSGYTARAAAGPMRVCEAPKDRNGLATKLGERIVDKVDMTIFEREPGKPAGVAKVFYNDQPGALAMAGQNWSLTNSFRDYAGGIFRVGLRNHRGAVLSAYQSGENLICIGEMGQRYSIEVENLSNHRLEFVVTVDGLDVLNGKAGSYSNRGYILDPGERNEIKGWRTSEKEVAAFRFGNVSDGLAQKTGSTANVGVIGAAVFSERGTTPKPFAGTDSYRRLRANPFVVKPADDRFVQPPAN